MVQSETPRRAALVTGGARGIGRAACLALAAEGMDIAINYAGSAAAAEQTAADCRALGVQAVALQADVRRPEACKQLVEDAAAAFGRLDVLVNNAGVTADKLLLQMTEADFDAVIETNLKGAFFCTKAAARLMMRQRYGRIISVSSVVGLHGNAGQANYAASKAGLIGLMKSVAKEYASRGVTANTVAPGFITTDMTAAMPEAARAAANAAIEAIQDSGLVLENIDRTRFGVILSSGIGGLPTIEAEHTRGLQKGFERVSPYFVPMSIGNMAAGQTAILFGLQGICSCPTTACAGGTNAIGDAFHRIRDGYEDRMLCGGTESCISPLGVGGFASMKALSTAEDPARASIPFDAERSGFVMGEGSGVLLLEELEAARARGAKIYAEIVGYGTNCDAYHFTAPAPDGVGGAACMRLALADGGVAPEQIGYINAHGTSTHLNDSCETAAIKSVFGDHAYRLAVSSTKSMTGHLLGGAGGVEGVFTALALYDGFLPATVNLQTPDPALDLDYIPNTGRNVQVDYAISDSLGFGGHNACVVLKRWEDNHEDHPQ